MTYFMSRFAAPLLATISVAFGASAGDAPLRTVVSSNSPERVVPVEPVAITRSGLAVARHDRQATGGLSAELAQAPVASSRRPGLRPATAPARAAVARASTRSVAIGALARDRAALRVRAASVANRQLVVPRQVVHAARPAAPERSTNGPSYLLGVFR